MEPRAASRKPVEGRISVKRLQCLMPLRTQAEAWREVLGLTRHPGCAQSPLSAVEQWRMEATE